MNELTDSPSPNEHIMNRTRFEARGRILCFDPYGNRQFVNKFTHVLIEGDSETDGETVYRLDDGSTVVFIADGAYRVVDSGVDLHCSCGSA